MAKEIKPNELSSVLADLQAAGGNKAKLMQQYSDEQRQLLSVYGGNISDIPADVNHPYHKIQDKINVLGRL